MKTLIQAAIEKRQLIHLLYDGRSRTVEPYLMGRNENDEDIFLSRQHSPWLPRQGDWQIYRLSKIYGLLVLEDTFQGPREAIELPSELLSGIRFMV